MLIKLPEGGRSGVFLGCGCVLLDRIVSISNMLYFCALGIGLICRKAALFGYRLDGCLFKVLFDFAFFGNIKQFHLFCKNNLVGLKSWISFPDIGNRNHLLNRRDYLFCMLKVGCLNDLSGMHSFCVRVFSQGVQWYLSRRVPNERGIPNTKGPFKDVNIFSDLSTWELQN